MIDGIDSPWVAVAVLALVALVVLRIRLARISELDRTPAQRGVLRVIDALAIAVAGACVLAGALFVLLAVLAVPWPAVAAQVGDRGAWPIVLLAVVLFALTLRLTPQWFRPAHLRAVRDDETSADGSRQQLFDPTGRTLPDGSGLDRRDGS